ncbi:MAG TPA: hypothetical protein DCM29_02780 [Bacteroides sp.]|nr:hypothetical protein [Bacteroides sp.]
MLFAEFHVEIELFFSLDNSEVAYGFSFSTASRLDGKPVGGTLVSIKFDTPYTPTAVKVTRIKRIDFSWLIFLGG